jgi:DNA adenine methylase
MQKPRSYSEIYNDIDSEVVNVFKVLRSPQQARELQQLLELTPFSRQDFNDAYLAAKDPVEQARRTLLKSYAGYGSDAITRPVSEGMRTRPSIWNGTAGFRNTGRGSRGTNPSSDWANYPAEVKNFTDRLRAVVIENRPALRVIEMYDCADALIYVDPPYVMNKRRQWRHRYRHELSDADHRELAGALHSAQGMVVVSGRPSELYDELYAGWRREEKIISDRMGKGGTYHEVLWFSPNVPKVQHELF